MKLTAVFEKVPEGYIGFIEELPGANTQGATIEETRSNLKEAVNLYWKPIDCYPRSLKGKRVIRDPFSIKASSDATSRGTSSKKVANFCGKAATTPSS